MDRLAQAVVDATEPGSFGIVVSGDLVTHGKPHPEPYLTAAEQLGVDPVACVAIEDSPTGVRSAVAAGVPTPGRPARRRGPGHRRGGAAQHVGGGHPLRPHAPRARLGTRRPGHRISLRKCAPGRTTLRRCAPGRTTLRRCAPRAASP
ncbi:HAD family hydrolase [Janibacter limosus]|uniref:HAD family hydrolase n=1 Tax=Janibacter limosus TaxID=53458 RepID=UPI0035D9610E